MRISSLLTMAFVSVLVFASAGYILYASFSDSESNIHVAERIAENVMDATSLNAQEADVPAPVVEAEQTPQIESCDPTAAFMQTKVSLVNYLKQNGLGTSYADRIKLASDHGIQNYTGNGAENLLLMKYLQEDLAVKNHCVI